MENSQPLRNRSSNKKNENASSNDGDQKAPANPYSLRDKFMRSLPKYSGPYTVGMMDMEVPVEQPRVFSHITRKKRHLLQLETVLFSIYYPAALGTGYGSDPSGRDRWSRETWLPKPRGEVARGYGQFAGTYEWVSIAWFLTSTWFTRLPAFRNAHIATHYPPDAKSSNEEAGSPPDKEGDSPVFPLMIFSHGLGGTRTISSTLLGEFASYGFVVVAMEHRDGSCARTFINHPPEGPGSRAATEGILDHSEDELKRPYDRIDYIFPQDNPYDTYPHSEAGVDVELREAQIELRKAEIKEVKRILQTICDGNGHIIGAKNLRNEKAKGSNTRGTKGVDWASWKSRFHSKQATICGHSFGAATAVEVLRDNTNFPDFSQGIALDMWTGPVPVEGSTIQVPLLSISSEAFMWWQDNFTKAKAIADAANSAGCLNWLLTVRGTIHLSQTDIPILYPRVCSALLKARISPTRAISLNVNLALEFLKIVIPDRISAMNRGASEGLLKVPITKEIPEECRPDNKWIGMRLKIPHEFATRVKNRTVRGKSREFAMPEDEIWMHVAPTAAQIESYHRPDEVLE